MRKLKPSQVEHVLTPEQLACLGSDALRAVVEVLAAGEPLSRSEIAQRVGRPLSSLHYQIAKLRSVGLVLEAGRRSSERRPEILYTLVAGRLSSDGVSESLEGRMALAKSGRRIAAATGRAFAKAVGAESAVLRGANRRAAVRRLVLSVSDDGLRELNALLDRFVTETQECSPGEKRITLTTILS